MQLANAHAFMSITEGKKILHIVVCWANGQGELCVTFILSYMCSQNVFSSHVSAFLNALFVNEVN